MSDDPGTDDISFGTVEQTGDFQFEPREPVYRLIPAQLDLEWYETTFGEIEQDLLNFDLPTRVESGGARLQLLEKVGSRFAGGALQVFNQSIPIAGPLAFDHALKVGGGFAGGGIELKPEYQADLRLIPVKWMQISFYGQVETTLRAGGSGLDAKLPTLTFGVRFGTPAGVYKRSGD